MTHTLTRLLAAAATATLRVGRLLGLLLLALGIPALIGWAVYLTLGPAGVGYMLHGVWTLLCVLAGGWLMWRKSLGLGMPSPVELMGQALNAVRGPESGGADEPDAERPIRDRRRKA